MRDVSAIICTHNPRPDYLRRVLDALRVQSLPQDQWELLLIDNASSEPLAGKWDLSWHSHARHIREDELGLTPARLRGITESTGNLLVFVDDDNVLECCYLEKALDIAKQFQQIGAFNGSTTGEFEGFGPTHLIPYTNELGGVLIDRDYWSNLQMRSPATPVGAGLCVRRHVADDYAEKTTNSPLRRILDRSGTFLFSGGDIDLAWCAIDSGMGTGRFKDLKIIHLIPKERMTEEYIIRLRAGYAASAEMLAAIRPTFYKEQISIWKESIRFIYYYLRASKMEKRIMLASRIARREARQLVEAMK